VPFTLAHPAAVLPLRGLPYLRTAPLVIGSLVPDLHYFLPGQFNPAILDTHAFEHSYTTTLALGCFALAAVFLLRRPLTALLSARERWVCLAALEPFRRRPLEWLLAPLAILLGIWTHLLWDSFTHLDGWMVHRVTALSAPVTIGFYSTPLCHVLQYLSSVFGLAVLTVWYRRLPVPARVPADPQAARSAAGPLLLLAAAGALVIGAVQATEHFGHAPLIYKTLNILLTRSLAWFAAFYLIAGSIVTLEQAHERVLRS
jgi:Domain of unknown function (DUF4184)